MSPDLTPMDFTFLNYLNNKVVCCQPKTIDEFVAFIKILKLFQYLQISSSQYVKELKRDVINSLKIKIKDFQKI